MLNDLGKTIIDAAEQLGRILSSALSSTDRQRINIGSTTVLYHGVLASTEWRQLYTASENTRTEVREWLAANNENVTNTVSFCIVPKGQAVGDDHLTFPEIEIEGKKFEKLSTNTSLMGSWSIWARAANPNRIVLHISGTEIVN